MRSSEHADPPRPAVPGLSRLLRDRTAEAHRAAEAAMRLDFDRPDASEYLSVLQGLLFFHSSVARFSWATACKELGQDMALLIRTQSLHEDIRLMSQRLRATTGVGGVAHVSGRRPDVPVVPHQLRGGREERIGAAYVAAGSVLGGRVIARRLAAGHGSDYPRSFFLSDGLELGRGWLQFTSALDTFGESGADSERVVAGALAAFRLIRAILRTSSASSGAA